MVCPGVSTATEEREKGHSSLAPSKVALEAPETSHRHSLLGPCPCAIRLVGSEGRTEMPSRQWVA